MCKLHFAFCNIMLCFLEIEKCRRWHKLTSIVDVSRCRITAVKKSDKVVCAPIIFQCFSPPLQQNPQDQHKINIAASNQFVRLPLKLVMMIPSALSPFYFLSSISCLSFEGRLVLCHLSFINFNARNIPNQITKNCMYCIHKCLA